MEQSSDTCGAVRPGYSATFNACMRGAGHDGVHISALGAKWSASEAPLPAQLSGKGEA